MLPMKVFQRLIPKRQRAILMRIQVGDCSSTKLVKMMNLILSEFQRKTLRKTLVKVASNANKPTSKRMIEPFPDLTTQFSTEWATTTKSSSIRPTTWITSTKKRNGTRLTSY